MAPTATVCMGCHSTVKTGEFMTCSNCSSRYDLECAGIPIKRYQRMSPDQRLDWNCPQCRCKLPKSDNSNTPIQPRASQQSSRETSNVAVRSKVLRRKSSDDVPGFSDELRDIIRDEIREALRDKNGITISEQLGDINNKVSSFENSLSFYNTLYEDLKGIIEDKTATIELLRKSNEALQSSVKDLTSRLTSVEQHLRSNNIEINGLPEYQSENLQSTVVQIAKAVDCTLSSDDILHVTRVAKVNKSSTRPRSVVAKLRNPHQRDSLLAAVMKFNRQHPQDRLGSQHLGIGGTRVPVYVSEHLCPTIKSLHAAARLKARELKYKFVWVRSGRIFVRKDESSPALQIHGMDSLKLIA